MRPITVVPLVVLLVACGVPRATPTTAGARTWRGVPIPDAAVVVAEAADSIMLDVPGGTGDVATWFDRRWRSAGLQFQEHGETRAEAVRLANAVGGRLYVLDVRGLGDRAGHTRVVVGESRPGR